MKNDKSPYITHIESERVSINLPTATFVSPGRSTSVKLTTAMVQNLNIRRTKKQTKILIKRKA